MRFFTSPIVCFIVLWLGELNLSMSSKLELRDYIQQELQAKSTGFLRNKLAHKIAKGKPTHDGGDCVEEIPDGVCTDGPITPTDCGEECDYNIWTQTPTYNNDGSTTLHYFISPNNPPHSISHWSQILPDCICEAFSSSDVTYSIDSNCWNNEGFEYGLGVIDGSKQCRLKFNGANKINEPCEFQITFNGYVGWGEWDKTTIKASTLYCQDYLCGPKCGGATDPPTAGQIPDCESGETLTLAAFEFFKEGAPIAVPVNNLGGFCGINVLTDPSSCGATRSSEKYIVYKDVGVARDSDGVARSITLVVRNNTSYNPYQPGSYTGTKNKDGHYNNGILGNVGQVNLRNGNDVSLSFQFYDGYDEATNTLGNLVQVSGYFAFFDIDAACTCTGLVDNNCADPTACKNCYADNNINNAELYGRDCISVDSSQISDPAGGGDIFLDATTSICMDTDNQEPGRTIFYGAEKGDGADNPESWGGGVDFSGLTDKQKRVAGMFGFENQDSLDIVYKITGIEAGTGRNLVFSAQLYICRPSFG